MARVIVESSAVVRFQLALSLGADNGPEASQALVSLAAIEDDRVDTAILTASAGRAIDLLFETNENGKIVTTPISDQLRRRAAYLVGIDDKKESIEHIFELRRSSRVRYEAEDPTLQALRQIEQAGFSDSALWAGLSEGLARRGRKLQDFAVTPTAREELRDLFSSAAKTVANKELGDASRTPAAQLVAQGNFKEAFPILEKLIDPRESIEMQLTGIRGIAGFSDVNVPSLLLKNYKTLTPAVRAEIVDALASSTLRQPALLDAIEAKQVAAADVPLARRALLMKSKDPTVAARAAKLLTQSVGQRADVVAKYRPALQMAGVAERGHKVFSRECKTCHRLREEGFDVGPNLATILHRSPNELMTHILDPNREVSPNYLEYAVALNDGRTLTGLIAEESAAGLTLRKAENVQQSILRSEIDEILSTGKSLMPEGLEQKLTPQDMADLLAFLLRRR
ncbi:MAG: c-type cytochrome [Planctomycetales bacterium]|nr:c-type cytochrome [Planctomycetales bacterium]